MDTFWFRNPELHSDKDFLFSESFLPKNVDLPNNYMIVGPDLWNSNSQESHNMFADGFVVEHLSADKINPIGYLDYFLYICPKKNIDCSNIEYLKIEFVDRGVWFKPFGNMLKQLFPNLKSLEFSQNWAYNPTGDIKTEYNEFLQMLKQLQLNNFYLEDWQSQAFKILKADDIFDVMPENSVFVLKSEYGANYGLKLEFKNENDWDMYKKYYEKRGTKEVYAYKRLR